MNRALMFFSALLLLFVGAAIFWFAARNSQSPAGSVAEQDSGYVEPVGELGEFEFTDQLAKPFGSKQLAGKVWMGSFFFADCPSICREQNLEIAKIHRRFADDGVMIINMTVTPDKDPPHKLLLYANEFGATHDSWKFLTGKDIDYVRQVGVEFFELPAANETHTSEVVVFDREGNMQGSYNVNKPDEFTKLVTRVEELLGGKSDASTSDADLTDAPTSPADETETVSQES